MLESKKIMNRTNEKVRYKPIQFKMDQITHNMHFWVQENLQNKKSKLLDQIKEARGLQVNTERRGKNIRAILSRNLDQETVEVSCL